VCGCKYWLRRHFAWHAIWFTCVRDLRQPERKLPWLSPAQTHTKALKGIRLCTSVHVLQACVCECVRLWVQSMKVQRTSKAKKMGLLPCLKLLWFEKNQSIKLGE